MTELNKRALRAQRALRNGGQVIYKPDAEHNFQVVKVEYSHNKIRVLTYGAPQWSEITDPSKLMVWEGK
jgi:hypothetical protein